MLRLPKIVAFVSAHGFDGRHITVVGLRLPGRHGFADQLIVDDGIRIAAGLADLSHGDGFIIGLIALGCAVIFHAAAGDADEIGFFPLDLLILQKTVEGAGIAAFDKEGRFAVAITEIQQVFAEIGLAIVIPNELIRILGLLDEDRRGLIPERPLFPADDLHHLAGSEQVAGDLTHFSLDSIVIHVPLPLPHGRQRTERRPPASCYPAIYD